MIAFKRMPVLLILLGIIVLSAGCKVSQPSTSAPKSAVTTPPEVKISVQPNFTATQPPTTPTSTFTLAPTPTPTIAPTIQPTQTSTPTPTLTPTQSSGAMVPGIYGAGGCDAFWIVSWFGYEAFGAHITWCVDHVEVTQDGSMIFVLSWKADYDFYQSIKGQFRLNHKNWTLTDNLNNRYDSSMIKIDSSGSADMVPGMTYFGTITFPHANPGAYRFEIYDVDYKRKISDILLMEPIITINEIVFKFSPLVDSYYSDKWIESQTDQGGIKLIHTKYPNCEISEMEPGQPQGTYINTLEIGTLKYDIYRTQQPDYSLREYVLAGGLEKANLTIKPLFQVTVPYENSVPCLTDVGSILASVKPASP